MRAMIESLDDVVFEIDQNHTCVNIWTTREDLLPRPKAEMIGCKLGEFMGKAFVTPFLPAFDRVLATGIAENVEYGLERYDGLRWFLGRINPLRSSDGTWRSVCFVVRDITDRKRAEESIRELSGKPLRIQDEERRHIARELHDDLAQILAGISMQLSIPTANPDLDPRTAAILEDTASLALQANEKVPNISLSCFTRHCSTKSACCPQSSGTLTASPVSPEFKSSCRPARPASGFRTKLKARCSASCRKALRMSTATLAAHESRRQ